MRKKFFSTRYEPALSDGDYKADPSEQKAANIDADQDELSRVRDSVKNEPAFTGDVGQYHLKEWLEKKRSETSILGNLSYTFAAALLAGPFAMIGAFMAGNMGWYGIGYAIVAAPVVEEFLKQSSMIYLLEKKPYRVFAIWQFLFSAVVTAGFFATVENLLYIHFYVPKKFLLSPEAFAYFRWMVCTTLHICCALIASMGLIRVWKKQLADGRAADMSISFPYFAIAIGLHCIYNFSMTFVNKYFIIMPKS